jgi:hypothetical protein
MGATRRIVIPTATAAVVGAAALALGGSSPSYGPGPVYAPGPQTGSGKVTQLVANLTGRKEISAAGRRNAGDRDGRGIASVILRGRRQICLSLLVSNIDAPNAAHIHRGFAGTNGPVVVALNPPSHGGLAGDTFCAQIDRRLHLRIRANPRRYYVNVHNATFPGGAIRGQLARLPVGE